MNALLPTKIKAIKLLILDVDGTLTDGLLYYGNQGEHFKAFHVHDGLGIRLLKKAGIDVAIITVKKGAAIENRMNDLGITHFYTGQDDKSIAYLELKKTLGLQDNEIAMMGDDLPDLPVMKQAGLSFAPKSATRFVLEQADYVTKNKAGRGAVREVCDLILETQQKLEALVSF